MLRLPCIIQYLPNQKFCKCFSKCLSCIFKCHAHGRYKLSPKGGAEYLPPHPESVKFTGRALVFLFAKQGGGEGRSFCIVQRTNDESVDQEDAVSSVLQEL